jgi:hypothetical protein
LGKDKATNFALNANKHAIKRHENILIFAKGKPLIIHIMED